MRLRRSLVEKQRLAVAGADLDDIDFYMQGHEQSSPSDPGEADMNQIMQDSAPREINKGNETADGSNSSSTAPMMDRLTAAPSRKSSRQARPYSVDQVVEEESDNSIIFIIIGTAVCIVASATAAACYQSRISGDADEAGQTPENKSIEDMTFEQMRDQQNRQLQ